MSITPLGKYLRKKRIDFGGISLIKMAYDLKISSAYLSAIETGKRDLPNKLQDSLVSFLNLREGEEILEFFKIVEISKKSINFHLESLPDEAQDFLVNLSINQQELGSYVFEKMNKILEDSLP